MSSRTTRRSALALAVLVMALGLGLAGARTRSGSAETPAVEGLPADARTRASMLEAFATTRPDPPPEDPDRMVRLPESAGPWIDAWNRIRDCARTHGYNGVPPVAPTFGDGRTPAPVVDVSSRGAQQAMTACPSIPGGLTRSASRRRCEPRRVSPRRRRLGRRGGTAPESLGGPRPNSGRGPPRNSTRVPRIPWGWVCAGRRAL